MDKKDWMIVDYKTGYIILLIALIMLATAYIMEVVPKTQEEIIVKDFPEMGLRTISKTTDNPCAAYCVMQDDGSADVYVNRAPRFIWIGGSVN